MSFKRASELNQYARAISRRKLIALTPAFVLALATAFAVWKTPAIYQASIILGSDSGGTGSTEEPLKVINERLRERPRLEKALGQCELNADPNREEPLSQTRLNLSANEISDSSGQRVVLSFRANDPGVAQCVVTELAKSLVVPGQAAPASVRDAESLRAQAAETLTTIRGLEHNNPWLLTQAVPPKATILPSAQPAHPPDLDLELESARDQRYKLEKQLADAEQRIAAQRQIVEQQKKTASLRDSPTYAVLVAKRTELQGQRDTLMNRQELTEKHPRVAAITDQINAINREIDELRQQDSASVRQSPEMRELNGLEAERKRLNLELELNAREIARRSASRESAVHNTVRSRPASRSTEPPEHSSIAESYSALKASYAKMSSQLLAAETATVKNEAQRIRFSIIEHPEPAVRVSRLHWSLILLASVFGLMLGMVVAVALEAPRLRSVQNRRDVEFYTQLPLLASIPRTVGPAERLAMKRAGAVRMAAGAVTAALATFVLAELMIAFDLLSIITKS
jgi:capsular polysaccharide biosynthesis protein